MQISVQYLNCLTGSRAKNNKYFVKDLYILSGHVCSFDEFTFLNHMSHKFKCLTQKSLLVTKNKLLLNKQTKFLKLELFSINSIGTILLLVR